jgi:response regulator RpfG family c-di-GMP phosphodiesterase
MSAPHKPCLLVVDDEREVCDSVYHLLYRRYRVLRAHGAAEAVELMAQHEVEIIMTDQRMPELTGVEMLQKLKSQYPEAIRMLFTGFADLSSSAPRLEHQPNYRTPMGPDSDVSAPHLQIKISLPLRFSTRRATVNQTSVSFAHISMIKKPVRKPGNFTARSHVN